MFIIIRPYVTSDHGPIHRIDTDEIRQYYNI